MSSRGWSTIMTKSFISHGLFCDGDHGTDLWHLARHHFPYPSRNNWACFMLHLQNGTWQVELEVLWFTLPTEMSDLNNTNADQFTHTGDQSMGDFATCLSTWAVTLDSRSEGLGFTSQCWSCRSIWYTQYFVFHTVSVHLTVMGTWCTDPRFDQ